MPIIRVLSGHTSAETAHITEDYPYGFILRCHRREWLEYKPRKGYRLVTQTSNPKRENTTYNKPKASVYVDLAVLYTDEQEHVQWATYRVEDGYEALLHFIDTYRDGLRGETEQAVIRTIKRAWENYKARKALQKA